MTVNCIFSLVRGRQLARCYHLPPRYSPAECSLISSMSPSIDFCCSLMIVTSAPPRLVPRWQQRNVRKTEFFFQPVLAKRRPFLRWRKTKLSAMRVFFGTNWLSIFGNPKITSTRSSSLCFTPLPLRVKTQKLRDCVDIPLYGPFTLWYQSYFSSSENV